MYKNFDKRGVNKKVANIIMKFEKDNRFKHGKLITLK